jgi:hypothetical protein
MPNSDPNFFYGQIPTVQNWDGYFGDKVDGTGGTLDSGFVIGSTVDATSTVEVLVPGSTATRTLADRFADTFNVGDFGAIGDRKEYSGALTCLAGTNPILTIAGADLSAVVPGQLVVMPLGGLGGGVTAPAAISAAAWLAKTVTVTTADPHNIPLGQTIQATIAGCTPDAYNGTFAVTPTSASTFTYTLIKDPTALTVAGTWVPITAGAKAIVASVPASNQIVLSGTVSTTLANIAYQATGNPTIGNPGILVTPLDVYTLTGGTFVVPTQVTVQTTKVVLVAINTVGSGGVDGTYTFKCTSLAATPCQFTGTITGGVLASITPIPTTAGIYQANPPSLAAEPIVDINNVSGLTDATVTLVMGANTVRYQGQASSIAAVTVPGGYSVVPANPVSCTGPGGGVTFNMTWTAPTVVIGTDNAPAINAASDAIRAQSAIDTTGRAITDAKLVFSTTGDYLVNGPLNFTEMAHYLIDGQNCAIYSCASGKPIFDEMGSTNGALINFKIVGDPTFPPRWSRQIGRVNTVQVAAYMGSDNISLGGNFTDCAWDYNFASEGIVPGFVRGIVSAPFSRIEDATNSSVWNVASGFVSITAPVDTAQSFIGGSRGEVALVNGHPNGYGVWMLGGIGHDHGGNYYFAHQAAFFIVASTLAQTTGLTALQCHVEGAKFVVFIDRQPPSGLSVPQFSRFIFNDASCFAAMALYGLGDNIVHVRLFNQEINVGFLNAPAVYFSDPSRVTFSGQIYGSDGTAGRWRNHVPADMTGIAVLIGTDAPEYFAYNLRSQNDTLVNGELSVSGGIQATDQIDATDGTVAAILVNTFGFYTNPDYPTATIDASPSVTATADVTGMQWLSDVHIINGGSGYSLGGTFTLVGGTHSTVAQGRITAIDGSGAVTSFQGLEPGSYSVYPPVGATTTTGGGGAGLVISPLFWGVKKGSAGVTVTNAGSGYTAFPGVTFSTPLNGAGGARGSVMMGVATSMDAAGISSPFLQGSASYADDAAAATGGVAVGSFYRNGSAIMIRVA